MGCGKHIDQALEGIPVEERCHCKAHDQETFDQTGERRVTALFKSALGH